MTVLSAAMRSVALARTRSADAHHQGRVIGVKRT